LVKCSFLDQTAPGSDHCSRSLLFLYLQLEGSGAQVYGMFGHARLFALLYALLAMDALCLGLFAYGLVLHGASVLILFAFEYCLLSLDVIRVSYRYAIVLIAARIQQAATRAGNPAAGEWHDRSLYLLYGKLFLDLIKLGIYGLYFTVLFVHYGMPIIMVRDLARSFLEVQSELVNVIAARKLRSQIMALPSPKAKDLADRDATCSVCFGDIELEGPAPPQPPAPATPAATEGGEAAAAPTPAAPPVHDPRSAPLAKLLPCGHMLHTSCMLQLIRRQQTCPVCRSDLGTMFARQRAQQQQQAAAQQQPGRPAVAPQQPQQQARPAPAATVAAAPAAAPATIPAAAAASAPAPAAATATEQKKQETLVAPVSSPQVRPSAPIHEAVASPPAPAAAAAPAVVAEGSPKLRGLTSSSAAIKTPKTPKMAPAGPPGDVPMAAQQQLPLPVPLPPAVSGSFPSPSMPLMPSMPMSPMPPVGLFPPGMSPLQAAYLTQPAATAIGSPAGGDQLSGSSSASAAAAAVAYYHYQQQQQQLASYYQYQQMLLLQQQQVQQQQLLLSLRAAAGADGVGSASAGSGAAAPFSPLTPLSPMPMAGFAMPLPMTMPMAMPPFADPTSAASTEAMLQAQLAQLNSLQGRLAAQASAAGASTPGTAGKEQKEAGKE
jgi:Ring finger domain